MNKGNTANYDIPDMEHLKRVLLSGKKAVFDGLGKFSWAINRYVNGKPDYFVRFEPDPDLKELIYDVLYYGPLSDRRKHLKTDIEKALANGKTIKLSGFGEVYIYWTPGYTKWDDFRGQRKVHSKPVIKFVRNKEFQLDTENLPDSLPEHKEIT